MELNTVDGKHSDIRAIVRIQPSTRPEAMIESVDTDRSKREEDQVSFGFESVSPDEKTRKHSKHTTETEENIAKHTNT